MTEKLAWNPALSSLFAALLCVLLAGLFAFLAWRGVRRRSHAALAALIVVFAVQMIGHAGYLAAPSAAGHLYWSRVVIAGTFLLVPPWLALVRSVTGSPPARVVLLCAVIAVVLLLFTGSAAMLAPAGEHLGGPYGDLQEGPLYWGHLLYTAAGALLGLGYGYHAARRHGGTFPGTPVRMRPLASVGLVPAVLLTLYALSVFGVVDFVVPFAWVAFGVVLLLSAGLLEAFVATHQSLESEHARVVLLNEEIEQRRRREQVLAAEKQRLLEEEVVTLREELDQNAEQMRLIGHSPAMGRVRALVRRLAPLESTVLITGETGTGKELVARELHALSSRAGRAFVAMNVAAMPENLLEAELFGHVTGAFTGASKGRAGLFERADGGTLFLDEIGDASASLQAKLLRVIQERVIARIGATTDVPVDVRLVTATHQDLEALVQQGRFREDLYYRLNVVHVDVPPLRARSEDVLPLAEHFLKTHAERQGKRLRGFTRGALEALLQYDWPGNVRQLQNAVERAVAMSEEDRVALSDLPPLVRQGKAASPDGASDLPAAGVFTTPGGLTLREVEDRYIARILSECDGNRAEAARRLGIGERTLYRRLKPSDSSE